MLLPSIFGTMNTMDDFMDDFFSPAFSYTTPSFSGMATKGSMNVDIKEHDDRYEMDVELPGYAKDEVSASLKEGYLTIAAEHSDSKDEKNEEGKYLRRERFYGVSKRSFYVGDAVTEEDIKAKFTNGVLSLTIPKKEAKPQIEDKKYIAIEG